MKRRNVEADPIFIFAFTQGCEPGSELRKKGRMHRHSIDTVPIDNQDELFGMKKTSPSTRAALEQHFERLRQKLARTGYISRGSVLARSVATSGRSGYQWTRKVAGKTVSVSLSQEQFEAMKQAVSNQRELRKTIEQMEKVSRQLLFQTTADTRRRKPLRKNVLGTI
jgi:hypothetical protein